MKSEKQLIMLGAKIGSGVTLLLVVLFIWAIGTFFKARGEDCRTLVSITSHHLERKGQNEFNPGLIRQCPIASDLNALGGGYWNSGRELSLLGGVAYTPWRIAGARVGGLLAGVTGYGPRPVGMAGLVVSLPGKEWSVTVIMIPAGKGVIAPLTTLP